MISIEIESAPMSYEVAAPDLEWDKEDCPFDTAVFTPDQLLVSISCGHLHGPRLRFRPILDNECDVAVVCRDLLLRRKQAFDEMDNLRLKPDGLHLGPAPTEGEKAIRYRQLEQMEASLDTELDTAVERLRQSYQLQQLNVTPLMLRNADEPHSLKTFTLYKGDVWASMHGFSDCDWSSMIRRQAQVNYDQPIELQQFLSMCGGREVSAKSVGTYRERIPEHVRFEVWRRDQGKCVRCGSRQKLEFDHIVPVAEGGSNSARNIELLCESCNRRKGSRV
jgi:hypothetical protein